MAEEIEGKRGVQGHMRSQQAKSGYSLCRSHLSVFASGKNYISKDIFHFVWTNVFLKHTCILLFDENL